MFKRSDSTGSGLSVATFRFDVTPPLGHSLCGGWIKPVIAIDDPLEGMGFVLLGAGEPIVICALDWTALANGAYAQWRDALAQSAGTTPERVTIHCVHQHNAPFACTDAEFLIAEQGDLPHILQLQYFHECIGKSCAALEQALCSPLRITHCALGSAKVERVASNRRINRDHSGKVIANRHSISHTEQERQLPEGPIDPELKTIAFYNGDRKIVASHYYATHPMSFYGDGRVTADIAGLARRRMQSADPDCLHIYFTGCAGNIAAGKYNDGSLIARNELTQRLYDAIASSVQALHPEKIEQVKWTTAAFLPRPHPDLNINSLQQQISNKTNAIVDRSRPAFTLAWLLRLQKQIPLTATALHLNTMSILHLPGECFVEYQLRAQKMAPQRNVAVAGYGDGGPWYIPTQEEFSNGGYEVSVAFCDRSIDSQITDAIKRCLNV